MDTAKLLTDTAERIFADHSDKPLLDAAERGEFPADLMQLVRDNGFHTLAMPSSGVELGDAFAVLKVAGRFALPLPLAEMLLANRWTGRDDELALVGVARAQQVIDIPWGRMAERIVGVADGSAEAVLVAGPAAGQQANLAGEPRDVASLGDAEKLAIGEDAWALLALSRVVQSAGALERVLELSLGYVGEREQFGRPIARFQAIQHHLAVMAAEVAAAGRAADAAVSAVAGNELRLEVAVARSRVAQAVQTVVELAHQVHGAMGYTHEHQLHHFTRRLWAWRDEYGGEGGWQELVGRAVAGAGADGVWRFVTARG